jgi:hypothetical protein
MPHRYKTFFVPRNKKALKDALSNFEVTTIQMDKTGLGREG